MHISTWKTLSDNKPKRGHIRAAKARGHPPCDKIVIMPADQRFLTEGQELQLRAALMPDEAGRNAAREWLTPGCIDRLSERSRRLLPLLYRIMKATDSANPTLPALRKVHVEYWAENHKLFRRTAAILRW